MAHMASSSANLLSASRQYQNGAMMCPGTRDGPQVRMRRAVSTCSWLQEALNATSEAIEASQSSKAVVQQMQSETQSWHVHHVHQQLPLKYVALGDDGAYVISCSNGITSWSGSVPRYLYHTLYKIINSKNGAGGSVAFAALGKNSQGKEVWFAKDGKIGYTWLGCDSSRTLEDEYFNEDHPIFDKVSFAPNDGWFALRKDGSASWKGLPESLNKALNDNWKEWDRIRSLSVGHDGGWFVKFGKGDHWHGVHPVLHDVLKHQAKRTGDAKWVELGPHGSFVALFERYTVWYGSQDLTEALLKSQPEKAVVVAVQASKPAKAAGVAVQPATVAELSGYDLVVAGGWLLSFFRLMVDLCRCLRPI